MIKADCIVCNEQIQGQACLIMLHSAPNSFGFCNTKKLHVCKTCYGFVSIDLEVFLMKYNRTSSKPEMKGR